MEATIHFVEIEAVRKKTKTVYRFYGRGVWKICDGDKWRTIDGMYVPARVLQVAAAQCHIDPPPLLLSERDIAQLCGGR